MGGHSHGGFDPSITRSRQGVAAVAVSLLALGLTAVAQVVVFMFSGSVALLADLIHNGGDALTAVPLGAAFLLRSERAEKTSGYFVVGVVFASAVSAGYEAVQRLINPRDLTHLPAVAAAGVIGFVGNELAARIRLRASQRLDSPALMADGAHARTDGYLSLGVAVGAGAVALGIPAADPVIALAITVVILRVTFQAWRTVRHGHAEHALLDT